jgi:nicotinamidase-related amidase
MKAVLVIDMLEDFFVDGRLKEVRRDLTARVNTLTYRARNANLPVIWIRQEFREDLEERPQTDGHSEGTTW